jgi:dihydroorotate dehydrogenase electron transfer subunit
MMVNTLHNRGHRDSIFVEDAQILAREDYAGEQHYLRLQAPLIARHALAGTFVHIQCDEDLPMRRPMSIMRVDPKAGWFDILYKAHGFGTRKLARRNVNDTLSCLGPIGVPFKQQDYRRRPLLIGGGVGIPPMVFLAEHLRTQGTTLQPLVLMGSEVPFPFRPRPSQIMVAGVPAHVIASMPLLDDWGIPSRLASLQGYPGCYEGYVTELARAWLDSLSATERSEVEVFACGPTVMLKAVAALAQHYDLPCQVSLEEYMACAVGGCAGCVVGVRTEDGPAMKRVCVDGPVFEARTVVFP